MSSSELIAQEEKTVTEIVHVSQNFVNQSDNSVGLKYSNISGYGINYTRKLNDKYSVSISGMIQYYEFMQWDDLSKNKDYKRSEGQNFTT